MRCQGYLTFTKLAVRGAFLLLLTLWHLQLLHDSGYLLLHWQVRCAIHDVSLYTGNVTHDFVVQPTSYARDTRGHLNVHQRQSSYTRGRFGRALLRNSLSFNASVCT